MMPAIPFSLKTIESLQNGVTTYFQVTPLITMRTKLQASSQSCRSVDADAWCKWALTMCDTCGSKIGWRLPLVSKPEWISCLCALFPVCNGFLRFTSGATPADLVVDNKHASFIVIIVTVYYYHYFQ